MLDIIRQTLLPWYMEIKFIHILFVMVWSLSTAVAYLWFVRSTFLDWKNDPSDVEIKRRRDWAMEQFDKGAMLEHIAFPIILVTGPLLYWLGDWQLSAKWLLIKLFLVSAIFIPMEIIDYWISHFGGRKARYRSRGDTQGYEQAVQWHWRFFNLTTPLVSLLIPATIFLAIVKPF